MINFKRIEEGEPLIFRDRRNNQVYYENVKFAGFAETGHPVVEFENGKRLMVLPEQLSYPGEEEFVNIRIYRSDRDRLAANLREADLRWADLREADLRWADLREADLREANLVGADLVGADLVGVDLRWADLRETKLVGADLRRANLVGADLEGADLREADLREGNLRWANLVGADLREANLVGTDLDYAAWPLWCGSLGAKADRRLAAQLAYHFASIDFDDDELCKGLQEALVPLANEFHRVGENGIPSIKPCPCGGRFC